VSTCTLLTGGGGFLGRHLLRHLRRRNVAVRLVLRSGHALADAAADGCQILETPDLFDENEDWWADACAGVDTVIHSAWFTQPGTYLHSPRNIDCLVGTLRLAQGALRAGVRRFIGIGTCLEYELGGSAPVGINVPLRPRTPYASAKAAAYLALSGAMAGQGTQFVWCRLFYLHGEGEDPRRLVPYLHRCMAEGVPASLSSGTQVRDYLDVAESAGQVVDVALGTGTGPFNVCSGRPVSVRALAERIADSYGRRDLLRFGDRPDLADEPEHVVGICNVPPATREGA